MRFRFDPRLRAFSNLRVSDGNAQRNSVDRRPKRTEMCAFLNENQEPITRSEATPFWPCNGVFTDQFIFGSILPRILSKNRRQEYSISDVLIAFTFSLRHYRSMDVHKYGTVLLSSREKYSKMMLKINGPVKTPLHRLSVRFAHSGIWAPAKTY